MVPEFDKVVFSGEVNKGCIGRVGEDHDKKTERPRERVYFTKNRCDVNKNRLDDASLCPFLLGQEGPRPNQDTVRISPHLDHQSHRVSLLRM